jgi:hypothetical protein
MVPADDAPGASLCPPSALSRHSWTHPGGSARVHQIPIKQIFGRGQERGLNLITCAGTIDRRTQNYDQPLVVDTTQAAERCGRPAASVGVEPVENGPTGVTAQRMREGASTAMRGKLAALRQSAASVAY